MTTRAVNWRKLLRKIDDQRWELPADYKPGMRVPGLIFADERMLAAMAHEQALEQVANVACLPGIVGYSMAMPDIHWGYGFPIGGVAAMRAEDGVVSPGGVGFDINCGTRLLRSDLREEEVRPRLQELVDQLYRDIPAGVGQQAVLRLSRADIDDAAVAGAGWAVERGYGLPEDLDVLESRGRLPGADPAEVSDRAKQRGLVQLGSLGSGNHFLEVQVVDEIFDPWAAEIMGLREPGQVLVFVHTGSRGFGHQICQDYLEVMEEASGRYGISLPDRQLACAPIRSDEGRRYLAAMACGANFAWANRQMITYWARQAFARLFQGPRAHLAVVYDVAHNIAKLERHRWEGREVTVCVHRKGATRAFPPGHPEVPAVYHGIGQPVLVPGDMGRYSYVCVGTDRAMAETWGSTCHGAGRVLSRNQAKRALRGVDLVARMRAQGILVRAQNRSLLAEEASEAYKDVADVVQVLERAGISRRIVRTRPIGVIKG